MRTPRQLGPYPDRHLDCQGAVETGFMAIIDAVEAAGWARDEVIAALAEIAHQHVLAEQANAATYEQIIGKQQDRA